MSIKSTHSLAIFSELSLSLQETNQPVKTCTSSLSRAGNSLKIVQFFPEISNVRQFIEPRQRMVDAGELTNFKEVETAEIAEIFGNVAHRFSTYKKYGINKGAAFEGRGIISIQFIMTETGWKISSMAWDDERAGLTIPDRYKYSA